MISKQKLRIMKVRFFIALSLLMGLCLYACASEVSKQKVEKPICEEWLQPDSAAYNKLGKRLATLLFSPKTVKCYHLVGKEKIEKDDVEIEKNFVRKDLLGTLKNNQIAVLQYALLKPAKSYEKDSITVMAPYMPLLEFEFTSKKETAHVVISLSDMTWTVIYDDKRQFNFNYANEQLISQFCSFYVSLIKNNK